MFKAELWNRILHWRNPAASKNFYFQELSILPLISAKKILEENQIKMGRVEGRCLQNAEIMALNTFLINGS